MWNKATKHKPPLDEAAMRRLYAELKLDDTVEVIHHVRIGFKEHTTFTVGVVVRKERRQSGTDSNSVRNWDDKYWMDHLTLRKLDGESTTLTMDEFTELTRLDD